MYGIIHFYYPKIDDSIIIQYYNINMSKILLCVFLYFRELEKLLSTRYYTMKLLPIKSRSQIFVPMIEMLDNLLVMGVIQSETDIQRLLCLLNPERLAPNNSSSKTTIFGSVDLGSL